MREFKKYTEAVLFTATKKDGDSDSVGPVKPVNGPTDNFTTTVADFLGSLGQGVSQPDENVGECGLNSSEGGESDIDFECLGEDGTVVKFGEIAILLPKRVIDAIKGYENSEEQPEGETEETETEESGDSEESEENGDENSEEEEEVA